MNASPPRSNRRSIHDYRILQPLGSGPSGEVFRARDLVHGGDVALKRFSADNQSADGLSRYAEAAAVAADLPETTACRLLELVPDPTQSFAVLEYIPGRDLGEYLRAKGPLGWPEAQQLFGRCAAALSAAHRAEIVHGALKPTNIRLTEPPGTPPLPRILDFGVTALRPSIKPEATRTYDPRAIEYQAPEQLLGLPATPASDLYSLGVLLFEALTGHAPFTGRPQEVAQHHMRTTPPSPRVFEPDLPDAAETTVLALLAKSPEARKAGLAGLLAPSPPPRPAPPRDPGEDLQTISWDRSKLALPSPTRRTPTQSPADDTIILPPMPAHAGGDGVTVIIDGMNREFLLDTAPLADHPSPTTNVHTHADATVFLSRLDPSREAAPAARGRWRSWAHKPWTPERKLAAIALTYGALLLIVVFVVSSR